MTEVAMFVQNEFSDDELVRYCFKYTRKDIENDYLQNGRSMIFETIASEKKMGGVSVSRRTLKGGDVWQMSARGWTNLQEARSFDRDYFDNHRRLQAASCRRSSQFFTISSRSLHIPPLYLPYK
jgi:hypothetical protein